LHEATSDSYFQQPTAVVADTVAFAVFDNYLAGVMVFTLAEVAQSSLIFVVDALTAFRAYILSVPVDECRLTFDHSNGISA
jgi:hypothetical protein